MSNVHADGVEEAQKVAWGMTLPEPGLLGPVHGIPKKNAGKSVNPELVDSLLQHARHVLGQGRRAEEALALLADLDQADATADVKCLQGRCFLELNKKPLVRSERITHHV